MILHAYQKAAVDHIHREPRSGLFLDMGMGKTAVSLTALTDEHLPVLVVAPKRVARETWPAERALWRPDLSMTLAIGSPADRARALATPSDLTVISRDNMAEAIPYFYRTVILDELSGFKDQSTARWKSAEALAWQSTVRNVWGLTGTPAPNGLMDLWAQVYLLDQGKRLGTTLGIYRERFFHIGMTDKGRPKVINGKVYGWDLNDGAEEKIHALLADICMSLDSKDYLDLPPSTRNLITVPLPAKARKAYNEMKRDLVTSLDLLGELSYTAANAAVMTGRLSQISAGFMYPDRTQLDQETAQLHHAKVEALAEIVEGTGSPVLVFYRFRHELAMIRKAFPEAVSIDAPDAMTRWNAGQIPIMLAHPASAGHGLNLQHGGHTIVWTTLPWALEEYSQANARLARQGQGHPVLIHHLMAAPVDQAILDRLDGKATVEQALRDALTRPI